MTHVAAPDRSNRPGTPCDIRIVSLEELHCLWRDARVLLEWHCPFTLPPWLASWWTTFGGKDELYLLLVEDSKGVIGFVPLRKRGHAAFFVGSPDVCDYLDVVTARNREGDVSRALLKHLEKNGFRELVLTGIQENAVTWTHLVPMARKFGWDVTCEQEGVSFDIELPPTWEDFLYVLHGKQRHELRRKFRRLQEAGEVQFRMIDSEDSVVDELAVFLDLFKAGRGDKAAFMTPHMTRFFQTLADALSEHHILKIGLLEIDQRPASAVMCFDHRSIRYLYNSGYAPHYPSLSVGLLCKALSIQDAIAKGISHYDLLKGEEIYKQRLGGRPRPIFQCRIKPSG